MMGLPPVVRESPPIFLHFQGTQVGESQREHRQDRVQQIGVFLWTATAQLLSMQGILSFLRMDVRRLGVVTHDLP
jgi:hypothetical protein